MPNGIDILQLNTVTSTSNADKLYVHQDDTLVQVTKSNFMSEINNNIADEYDSTSTYAQGDYCMYNGQLYVCTTTISTSEEWNSSHWTSTTCADGFNANGIPMSEKGSVNGVAELDANGKVPTSQLPSYVDDVLEYSSLSAFPSTGETGKIYIALDTNLSYRWSGTVYVEISPSLALGETSSTAYRGDRGATAYTHSQTTSGNPHNVTKSDVGLGNVENFKSVSTEANQGLTNTEQSNAKDNLGLSTVATSGSYTDLTDTPTVDSELDDTSLNPIANKPVAEAIADIVGDISDIDSNIEGSKQLTTTGNVITVSDSAATYLEELEVEVEPIQDLHGYDYPWVGGAGKNLWDEEWELGRISASTGENVSDNEYIRSKNYIKVTPNTTYYFCVPTTYSTGRMAIYDSNQDFLEWTTLPYNVTYTTGDNAYYIRFVVSGTTYNNDIAINYPSTATSYAPYSNICPISGYTECEVTRTGVNQWDEEWESGVYAIVVGTELTKSSNANYIRAKNKIRVVSGETYFFQLVSQYDTIIWVDANNIVLRVNYVNDSTYTYTGTAPTGAKYVVFYSYGTSYNNNISVNYPSTVRIYQPYQGQTYTVTFNDTVYSGTLDVTTGVLTVDKAITRRTEFDYKSSSTYNYIYRLGTINKSDITNIENTITDKFKYKSVYSVNESGFFIGMGAASSPQNELWVGLTLESGADTLAKANTWLANNGGYVDVLYELATPQVYSLTPTQVQMLKGYNTVTTDANGGMTIKYQPDNVVGDIKAYASRLYDDIIRRLNELSS